MVTRRTSDTAELHKHLQSITDIAIGSLCVHWKHNTEHSTRQEHVIQNFSTLLTTISRTCWSKCHFSSRKRLPDVFSLRCIPVWRMHPHVGMAPPHNESQATSRAVALMLWEEWVTSMGSDWTKKLLPALGVWYRFELKDRNTKTSWIC